MVASTRVAGEAAEALVGQAGGVLVAGLVVVSVFGALNGIVMTGPRVYHAMAQDRLAFAWLGALHPKYATPHLAIIAQGAWASALVATNTYRELFTRVIYTEWLFFALLAVAVFRLKRVAGHAPKYLPRAYPALAAAFVAASVLIVATQVRADPRGSATGLLLVALGLPVYWMWKRKPQGAANGDH
jgi:APA family basic amino acid/polyamine antiporter